MAIVEIKQNDNLPLHLMLDDGATNKYPRVILRNEAGNAIIGSPVDLIHVGEGLYTDDSIAMTNDDFITASYLVYSDSGHLILDTTYGQAVDVFVNKTLNEIAAADIADAVWDETISDHANAGSTGKALNDVLENTTDMLDILDNII